MAHKKTPTDITIIDVAREAGVSYSTVSRVVNNKTYVKPETRERVAQAMHRLGYQANLQARSLAGGQSHVIGLLVHNMSTQYMAEIFRGIDDVLATYDYELMLYTTHRRRTKESTYVNMMARGLADGLLIVLPRQPEAYIESLRARDFPYVLIDQVGIDENDVAVTATNFQGGYDATSHLIALGHRRIGKIAGWMDMVSARDRLDGYKAALSDHGIPVDPDLIVMGNFEQSSGYQGAETLLDLAEPPTAVFASNDVMAQGALELFRERGRHVPQDMSLVGFDDIPLAAILNPPLTTLRQPMVEMGRQATQMLLDWIGNPAQKPTSITLPTELVQRASTAPPRL
ncbi:MAG TPA: LacI family DNA-binding transcriptional regulator [Chloroflexota bacterium]|nr:LacI family DNA-binding transcriptional regulator [Chloroflexota bacterium]HUM67969.1 LacI family DNA-binding transcriptional regulator [Chloroflexota bacterium]